MQDEVGFVLSSRTGLYVVWEQHPCTGEPVATAEKIFLYPGGAAPTKLLIRVML